MKKLLSEEGLDDEYHDYLFEATVRKYRRRVLLKKIFTFCLVVVFVYLICHEPSAQYEEKPVVETQQNQ